jgi:hypothetical protein
MLIAGNWRDNDFGKAAEVCSCATEGWTTFQSDCCDIWVRWAVCPMPNPWHKVRIDKMILLALVPI